MKIVDDLLDNVSMYKLLSFGLLGLSFYAIVLSFLGLNGFSGVNSLVTLGLLFTGGVAFHYLFSYIWRAPAILDSTIISTLIVFLVVSPITDLFSFNQYLIVLFLSFIVVASKYLIALNKVHVFNPAAFVLAVNILVFDGFNPWAVGSVYFFIPVIIFSYLILKKQNLFYLFNTYIVFAFGISMIVGLLNNTDALAITKYFFLSGPALFFASVMLTVPTTLPNSKKKKYLYAILTAVLASVPFSVGRFFNTPEIALVISNVFSYFSSFKKRVSLTFVNKEEVALNTYEFTFKPESKVPFLCGQYGELTIPREKVDIRGMRRYFTITNEVNAPLLSFGIRMASEHGSSFKNSLMNIIPGDQIILSSINGDFVLPSDLKKKIVFIAGGIGITPFIAMLRETKERGEKRDFTLFYLNKKDEDVAYKDLLNSEEVNGVEIINVLSDVKESNLGFGEMEFGFLNNEILKKYTDFTMDKNFYLSGPPKMVDAFNSNLRKLGVKGTNIMTDYFPGYN